MQVRLNRSLSFKGPNPATRNTLQAVYPNYSNWDGSAAPTGFETSIGNMCGGSLGGLCYFDGYLWSNNGSGQINRADPSDIAGTTAVQHTTGNNARSLTTDGVYWYEGVESPWGEIHKYDMDYNFVETIDTGAANSNQVIHALDYYGGKLYAGRLTGEIFEIDLDTHNKTSLGTVASAVNTLTGVQVFDDYLVYLNYNGTAYGVSRDDITAAADWSLGGINAIADDIAYNDDDAMFYGATKALGATAEWSI